MYWCSTGNAVRVFLFLKTTGSEAAKITHYPHTQSWRVYKQVVKGCRRQKPFTFTVVLVQCNDFALFLIITGHHDESEVFVLRLVYNTAL